MAIEDLIKSAEAYEKEQLDSSVIYGSKQNPEQAAKVYNLSREKGLPTDYVGRNFDKVSAVDTSTLTPSVAQLLRDREKSKIAHDDIENLSWWEAAAKNTMNFGASAAKSISSSGYSALGSTFNAIAELSGSIDRAIGVSEEDIKRGDFMGPAGKYMLDISRAERQAAEYYMGKETGLHPAVAGGIKSAIMNVPALAAGILSRSPSVALGAMGGVTYGDSYLTAKDAGLDETTSMSYAANQTIAEVVPGSIPAIKLIKDIGADAGLFKTVAAQMAWEIPTEQITTVWQNLNDWATINPDKTINEFLEESKDDAINTLISTVVATGLQTSAVVGIDRLTREKEKEQVNELLTKAAESKVRGRSPEMFGDYVDDLVDSYGSSDAVYIDAKEARPLFQEMVKDDAYDLIASQIDEAEAVGGDIVIPMRDFLTVFPASKNIESIKGAIRLTPESRTTVQEGQPQRIADLIKTANKNIEIKNRADEIYKEVTKQLINTGRMNADVAKTSASIIPAYVTTKSIRSGLSVDEVYGMMGLSVQKADSINDIGLKQNTLSEWDAILASLDYADKKPQQGKDDATEFLSNAPAGTRYTDESKLLKRIRKSSDQVFNELGGSPEAGRVGKTSLGQFSAYRTQADIIEPDSIYPDGRIEVHVFGKEQDEQGLNAEPALTFTVSKDGELSVNGPTGETFNAFKGAGWAKESVGKSGEVQSGWTSLVNKDGSQMPLSQLLPLIADVHARVRAWRGDDKIGLHWSRSTGATGGIVGGRQTAVFFQSKQKVQNQEKADALISEISDFADISNDGLVTVYHRTSKENAEKIKSSGVIIPKEDGIFFSTKADGQAEGYGDTVITMKIPADKLELDDIFDDEAHLRLPAKVKKENDVSQYLVNLLEQSTGEARGSFDPSTGIIKLTEASDLSTFLHESGHLFLEMEGRLFNHPNATDQMKADGKVILDWLGLESFDQLKDYETNNVSREAHEKFARGFEKYLGEGKAPSVELKSVFRRFAAWMRQVYRDLRKLNVELTDDVRAVMDRMLASDDQINRLRNGFDPLFKDAKDAGMTEAEFKAYSAESTMDNGKEVLLAKMIKQLNRQYTKWWKDESSVVAARAKKDLLKTPIYSASEFLKGNHTIDGVDQIKLNSNEVREQIGKLSNKFKGMTDENGESADNIAAMFGFSSGFEMIDMIQSQPTFNQAVKTMTEQEMIARHGDILNDGTIREEAEQAIRNPEQAKRLIAELNALSRKTGDTVIDRESIKAYAKETIGKMAVSKIRPAQYRSAEIRAAREAAIAKDKGETKSAIKAKTQELINFYLSREATDAKQKADRIRISQKAIQTRKYSASNIDMEHVNQAKILLKAYDFRKTSERDVAIAKANLAQVKLWIESQQQDPNTVSTYVKADVLGKLISYPDMTLDDLQGLDDVVNSILHAGRVVAEENKAEYRANIDEGKESIIKNRIDTYETEADTGIPWVRVKSLFNEATASLRKFESLARQSDGMSEQGWVWRNTVKPLLDAANEKLKRQRIAHAELREIFKDFSGAFSHMKDIRTFTTDAGQKIRLSYAARISIALNMGNDGNIEALKTSNKLPLSDADLNRIVGTLSDSDFDLVQKVWDYIDTYWPEIASLEIKRSGVAPQKVLPRAFITPSGKSMRGGYYPLAGDSAADGKQLEQDIDTMYSARMNGGDASKSTKHGSTIERVGFGGKKVDFSINVLFNHIDGVIHDITHWKAVKDVDRVLKNEKINSELSSSLGLAGVRAMKQRLKEIAVGPQRLEGLGWINRILRHARLASTYSALGYSVRTAAMNTMGITTAIADMNPKSIAAGVAEYYSNLPAMNKMILEKSEYMRDRGLVLNRDIAYIRANLRSDDAMTKFRDGAFWMMTQVDKGVTRPIWLAAYRQGEMMFDNEQAAIDYADRMVARTQGSGMDLDLANVETKNELVKTMTVMYTAFSAMYNISTEQIKRYKSGKITGTNLALRMSWLIVMPGILTSLLTGSDEDEPEDILWEVAGQGIGMIPIARDAFSYARYGSSFPTPIVRLGTAPIKFVEQLSQGEIDKGLVGAGTELASWLHIPGGAQLTRTYGYLSDMQDGEIEEFSPIDLLITGKE